MSICMSYPVTFKPTDWCYEAYYGTGGYSTTILNSKHQQYQHGRLSTGSTLALHHVCPEILYGDTSLKITEFLKI